MREPQKGDYVLATKYRDGDVGDHFAIGFYDRCVIDVIGISKHYVVDSDGDQFRGNGFRRVAYVSKEKGEWFVRNLKAIEQADRSVWYWYYASRATRDKLEGT
jgi:hypothetical protein